MNPRIITHNDFDGIISAAICSKMMNIDYVVFTGPRAVSEARIPIYREDIVCDLPYPLECGLWFDHHEGNLEDLQYRKIDPASLPGRFEALPSCAHVVFKHFAEQHMPDHFGEMVAVADIIDSFNYQSIEDWRSVTPGKMIDAAIKLQSEANEQKWPFLRSLIGLLKERPLAEVAATPGVTKRYRTFQQEEEQMLEQIEQEITFLPQDAEKRVIILDLTRHNRRPQLFKYLSFLLQPQAWAVLEVRNLFRQNVKTNDLSFNMSLSLNLNLQPHQKDIGEIMRSLNIGNGHSGAGSGSVPCASKDEMMRTKTHLLQELYDRFMAQ